MVTLALAYDVDATAPERRSDPRRLAEAPAANNSTPYTSTIVFLVRKGNPKGIKDWDDLVKPGVQVITPNPKTSAARGGTIWRRGTMPSASSAATSKAKEFVAKLYKNVPVLDSGARGSTTTFVERGIGDVFLSGRTRRSSPSRNSVPDKFEIVVPSLSILAQPPVAVVDKVVDKRGTRKVAEAYLEYLYSEAGQEIAASNFYRPTNREGRRKACRQVRESDAVQHRRCLRRLDQSVEDAFPGRRHVRSDLCKMKGRVEPRGRPAA